MGLIKWLGELAKIKDKGRNKKSDIKNIFKKSMAKLSPNQIKNQVLQILNYERNFTSGYEPLITLLANCNMTFKKI